MSNQSEHGFRRIEPRPMTFLSLAPAVSNSYPSAQEIKPAKVGVARRSSSLSSNGSMKKILKLGPVHWGEHVDEHKDDFHEVAVEE